MNKDEKNQVIIQEILKWKENRLLPAEQCDFLLALYTKGGEIDVKEEAGSRSKSLVSLSFWKKVYFGCMVICSGSMIIADYFEWLSPVSAITILILVFLASSYFYRKIRKQSSLLTIYLFLFVLFLYLLQIMIYLSEILSMNHLTNWLIILNLIGWIIFGYKKKMPVFLYAGIILVSVLIIYGVFSKYMG